MELVFFFNQQAFDPTKSIHFFPSKSLKKKSNGIVQHDLMLARIYILNTQNSLEHANSFHQPLVCLVCLMLSRVLSHFHTQYLHKTIKDDMIDGERIIEIIIFPFPHIQIHKIYRINCITWYFSCSSIYFWSPFTHLRFGL